MGETPRVPKTDPRWVAELTGAPVREVAEALTEATKERALEEHVQREHRAAGREFYAEIQAPLELYALARILKPRHIVEVVVSSGVSSAYFLKALQRNGQGTLHSIDFPTPQKTTRFSEGDDSPVALPPGRSSGWAVPSTLRQGWDLRIGRSEELLPPLVEGLDRVEIFLHDDLHTFEHATWEFQTVDPKVPSGGVVLADNTNWLDGALDRWASRWGSVPVRRTGTWLCGFRKP